MRYYTNVSRLATYALCPMRGYFTSLFGSEETDALYLGTLCHLYAEAIHKGESDEIARQMVERRAGERADLALQATQLMKNYRAFLHDNIVGEPIIFESEKVFTYTLDLGGGDSLVLVGRPDTVVKIPSWDEEAFWHLQLKTTSIDPINLANTYVTNFHERAYGLMMESAGYTPYAGTLLLTINKGKSGPRFQIFPIPLSKDHLTQFICDAKILAEIILEKKFFRNPSACKTWNRLCPYFQECTTMFAPAPLSPRRPRTPDYVDEMAENDPDGEVLR